MIARRWHRRTAPPSRKVEASQGCPLPPLAQLKPAGTQLITQMRMDSHQPGRGLAGVRRGEQRRLSRAMTRPSCGSCRCGHRIHTLELRCARPPSLVPAAPPRDHIATMKQEAPEFGFSLSYRCTNDRTWWATGTFLLARVAFSTLSWNVKLHDPFRR